MGKVQIMEMWFGYVDKSVFPFRAVMELRRLCSMKYKNLERDLMEILIYFPLLQHTGSNHDNPTFWDGVKAIPFLFLWKGLNGIERR